MDELALFTLALGINKPWEVIEVKFSKEAGRLDLKLDFPRGATFLCPSCGKENCPVHDTKERTWRHLDFFQYETYIQARVPRVNCKTCGVKQVEVPWARPGSGFTLLFEMLILQLSREMSIVAVADLVRERDKRIWRILDHYVELARKRTDISKFHVLGIDEFSIRKGHHYMTAFSDIDASRVLYVAETRQKGVVDEFARDLEDRGYDAANIDQVCCDMWDPYINGVKRKLPQASIVLDRFHIMKHMNRAVDDVRRAEQKSDYELKKTRFIWLKNPKNLSARQAQKLADLTKLDSKTAKAYQIKLALMRFWEIKCPKAAEQYLKKWYFWATHSRLAPVIKAAKTIKRYWQGVVNYTYSRITNGVVEGLNSKIKTAMKRAYGFKAPHYLKTIVYLVAGKLCFQSTHTK